MAMILDTDLVPPEDRADAVGQAMQLSGIPARITHEPPPEHIFARIKLWQLGGGTTLMHRNGSGLRLTRTPSQLRAAAPERISLSPFSVRADGPTPRADRTGRFSHSYREFC